jgi:hypothetical protein
MANGTRNPQGSIDWEAIEFRYVTGGNDVSQRRLALEHGVGLTMLSKVATREEWVAKRLAHRERVAERALETVVEEQAADTAAGNRHLGAKWYQLACQAVEDALGATKASDRQQNTVAAGIATEKWRLTTGQTTAKAQQEHSGKVGSFPVPVFSENDPVNHFAPGQGTDAPAPDDAD